MTRGPDRDTPDGDPSGRGAGAGRGPAPADPTAPLAPFLADLRARLAPALVPGFDPRDGGAGARVLLLLEKPGPGVARSGMISRDNPDPTARAVRAFAEAAGLPRDETVIWNAVPAWNGTVKVTAAEAREGLGHLARLLPLLPALDTVVLVGARAGAARALVEGAGLRVLASAHPSPNVRAAFPDRWAAIPAAWAAARDRPRATPAGKPRGQVDAS